MRTGPWPTNGRARPGRSAAGGARRGLPRRAAALLTLLALLVLAACGPTRVASVDQLQPRPAAPSAQMQTALLKYYQAVALLRQEHLLDKAVSWYLSRMSLDDQIAQLLTNRCACGGGSYSPDLAQMVEVQHVGGIIFYADNFGGSMGDVQNLMSTIQANAPVPLFLGTDQEGGPVDRIGKFFGWFPSARDLGNSNDTKYVYADGQRTAQALLELGMNADFAPDVDVPMQGGGIWGSWRSFADDPGQVAKMAGAYLQGVQSDGVMATLKHFPGIGAATVDPHAALPVINRTLDQFDQTELYPYQAIMADDPGMVMATDVLVPSVDPTYPAELSPAWIDGVLRKQLGYNGVVTTDAIWMAGITQHWSVEQAAVLAIEAGDDIVEGAGSAAESAAIIDAIRGAVDSGQISQARIAQSAGRILRLKIQYGMLSIPPQLYSSQPGANP